MASIATGLKNHPAIVIIGILATILGFVINVPSAWNATTRLLNIPECGGYYDAYRTPNSRFVDVGGRWNEEIGGRVVFEFEEFHRDRDYIVLLNVTPREGLESNLLVRIPACGGTVEVTLENPQRWVELGLARPE